MKNYFALIILLALHGCGAKWLTGIDSKYPADYGTLPTPSTTECPDISGTYTNEGNVSYNHRPLHRLLSYHFVGPGPKPSTININAKSEQIFIFFDGSIAETFQVGSDFICQEGAIWLKANVESGAGGIGGYRAETVMGLRKATNGDLIGEERLSSVGPYFGLFQLLAHKPSGTGGGPTNRTRRAQLLTGIAPYKQRSVQ